MGLIYDVMLNPSDQNKILDNKYNPIRFLKQA